MTHGDIIFVQIPESLRGEHFHTEDDVFYIDPDIPIPVEVQAGSTLAPGGLDGEEITLEAIIAAMIQVIAGAQGGEAAHPHSDYYRDFVQAARPNLLIELSGAALAKAKNGDFDAASDITRVIFAVFPDSAEAFYIHCLVLEEKQELLEREGREKAAEIAAGEVETAYHDALNAEEILSDTLFSAGFFYMRRQNYTSALECFSDYIPLADSPEKKQQAAAIVADIQKRHLDNVLFKDAYDLIRAGRETEGMEKIRVFLEKHADVWNGWFLLGWALRRLSRWTDGAAAFSKALELGGNNADTHNELAICLIESGDLQAAKRHLEKALAKDSENIKIISNLAIIELKQGRPEQAAAFFRTVLEIAPDDPIATQFFDKK